SPIPPSMRSGSAAPIRRVSPTSKRSWTPWLAGRGKWSGFPGGNPPPRNSAEAKQVLALVRSVRLKHGYLENQAFAPQVERGRELLWARGAALTGRAYLPRAAREHPGPHLRR